MAAIQNFRSALNGFNREDVAHYIEYLNSMHNSALNQLKSENQALLEELNTLKDQPVSQGLEDTCAQLQAENHDLQETVANLQKQLEAATAQNAAALTDAELEAYRRAERAERAAKERAQQIYRQATGTLADATAQVDDAAQQFDALSAQFAEQLAQLQDTIARSKNALLGAAATMYTIRPEETDAE